MYPFKYSRMYSFERIGIVFAQRIESDTVWRWSYHDECIWYCILMLYYFLYLLCIELRFSRCVFCLYPCLYLCLYSTACMSTGIETCIGDVSMCVYREVVSWCASPRVLAMYWTWRFLRLYRFCICACISWCIARIHLTVRKYHGEYKIYTKQQCWPTKYNDNNHPQVYL